MKGDQWNDKKSKMGPVEYDAYGPVFDLARQSSWDYYKEEGDYNCNPKAIFSNHVANGFSNFELGPDDDSLEDAYNTGYGSDIKNGAGLRKAR